MLETIGYVLLWILFPFLYFGLLILLILIVRWAWMFFGVITGNRDVIEEFDCHKKRTFWDKLFDLDKPYDPPHNREYWEKKGRKWK